ncbi:replication initiation factor domain-containing protein [Bacillus cereus group sp. BfR-BA-01310]|uniref:replication initiation factor domain-containing protein n=1 Tax=Bacillus cereus group sp. BfR-BA-01310 TaxID=2920287 RepID=UPI001F5982F5|nr:replication initiation factor domain-containing protein [Bacillus cereus group sp. BfR-BA-01310]
MKKVDISIDNLTIIAFDTGTFSDYVAVSPYISSMSSSKSFAFRNSHYCIDGTFIETGNDQNKVRIEFNPNKASMKDICELLTHLKYPYLTRMDLAVDYFNYDSFHMIDWRADGRRKRNYWEDMNGTLETLYIGSQASHKQHRIYNKLKERQDNGGAIDKCVDTSYWRVEVQKRFKESDNIFDVEEYFMTDLFDITPCRKDLDLSFISDVKERIMVRGLLANPIELDELNVKTRSKYRKLIKQAREGNSEVLDYSPNQVYKKKKGTLIRQLKNLLDNCQNPIE